MKLFTEKWVYRAILVLLFFTIYTYALSPGVSTGDGAELASAAMVMGVPHPPGYPLWTVIARLFVTIFPKNPGFGTNLFSMLTGLLSILLAFEIVSISSPYWLALLVGANIGLLPQILNYSTLTEVYSLSICLFLLLLFLYKTKKWGILSYVSGLSFGAHPVLVLPVLVYASLLIKKRRFSFILFSLGLSILVLPLISSINDPIVNWMGRPGLKNWLSLLTRSLYYTIPGLKIPFTLNVLARETMIYLIITIKNYWYLLILIPFSINGLKKDRILMYLLLLMGLPLALIIHYPPVYDSAIVNKPFFVFQAILLLIAIGIHSVEKYKIKGVLLSITLIVSVFLSKSIGYLFPDVTGEVFIKQVAPFIEDGDVVKTQGDTFTFLLLYQSLKEKRFKIRVEQGLKINPHLMETKSVVMNDKFTYQCGPLYSDKPCKKKWEKLFLPKGRRYYPDTDAKVMLAIRWLKQERINQRECKILLERLKDPMLLTHIITIGRAYLEHHLNKEGVTFLKKYIKRYPKSGDIYHLLYLSFSSTKEMDSACYYLWAGLNKTSFKNRDLLNDAGIFFATAGDYVTALHFFILSNTPESIHNAIRLFALCKEENQIVR